MPSVLSKEDWLKGVLGLGIVMDALIPTLKRHYLQKAKEWSTDDDHLKHLLDLGASKEVKQVTTERSTWYVNCSECRSILKMIEISHRRPERLMWMNNQSDASCPSEYRLAKIFMPGGNEKTKDYSDLDALAVLEIFKNDTCFEHSYNEIVYLILLRNRLVHSNRNCISAEDLDDAFYTMKKLLQDDMFKNLEECITAVEELDKLQEKNMMCEVDESDENWKLAIKIQKQALEDAGIPSPEAMQTLVTKIQTELQKEKMQQWKLKTELSKSEEQRVFDQRLREIEQRMARTNLARLESKLKDTENKHKIEMQKLNGEKEELQRELDELTRHTPTFFGRIVKGTATGSGVGTLGGPGGTVIGGAAGGVVGGLSYLWDKVSK